MPVDTFDVIVIGAGPPGENVAELVVRGGLSCAVVESELVGGECSYWACMPSKALLRPWAALQAARAVPGIPGVPDGLSTGDVLASRDAFASHWRDESQVEWLDDAGAVLFRGRGRLVGERRVDVASSNGELVELTATHAVVVSTGSRAAIPDIPGLKASSPWTNHDATSASEVPESLAIIGGGPVGVEMATAWAALGSDVTLLARSDRLLPRMEPFAGDLVGEALLDAGVDVRTSTSVDEVSRDGDGPFTLHTSALDDVVAAKVLVAAGREPRTDEIGVETVGIKPGDWLHVDGTGQVEDVEGGWLYAVGDVNGRALLTHQGKYQARQTGNAIVARAHDQDVGETPWGAYTATADETAVPQVVFTHPQVATVGVTADAAQTDGDGTVRAVDYDLGRVAGAALHGSGYKGRARLVVDDARHVVVGATFVGPDVGELLHAATIAVVGGVPIDRLWHAVPAYPTISEVWLRLLETYASS